MTALGVTGSRIVYAVARPDGCHELRIDGSGDLARHCFPRTSTGSGIAASALLGRRALYLSYTGGNVREWTLWTETNESGPPHRIASQNMDVDAPAPFLVAPSAERALVYAWGSRIVAFGADGIRIFAYDAGQRVTAVSSQPRGVAAVLETGRAIGLSYDGELVQARDFPAGEPQVAELTVQGLLVKTRTRVELGAKSYALPANARWHGFASGTFAYGVGNALYIGRISDGRQAFVRRFEQRYIAQLGRITLATASGRTLSRERRADVVSRAFE